MEPENQVNSPIKEQSNHMNDSANSEGNVFSFKNIVIYLVLIFSIVCFYIVYLMISNPYIRTVYDISSWFLYYSEVAKYELIILFFWLTSALIVEKFLQKGMNGSPHTPKIFIKYFFLYFFILTVLVNLSFLIIHGLFVYFARAAGRCGDWCGIELYIFPFVSLPYIAGFALARYFFFVSFKQGFFSAILLRFTQKTKFIMVGLLTMWVIVTFAVFFEYSIAKNNTKIILQQNLLQKEIALQEKEKIIGDQTTKLCQSLEISADNKVLCYEEAKVLSKIHFDAHLSFTGDSFESEMQKSKFRLVSNFISKINIPNDIRENAKNFSFSTITIDKDFPDLIDKSTAIDRFGGLYSSIAIHSNITYSSATTTLDSQFYKHMQSIFLKRHSTFRMDYSYKSNDYKNGNVEENLSYTVYIPVEAFFNDKDAQYDSAYVFGSIKELVAIQKHFLQK